MASLREQIALELVARLDALTGWTAALRGAEETTNVGILAVVAIAGETKRPANQLFYSCTLRLSVLVRARHEDADPVLDGGNPLRYMDRLVAEVERAVHATPWPNEQQPTLDGHELAPPGDPNVAEAVVNLTVEYRHNYDDPDTYDPAYP